MTQTQAPAHQGPARAGVAGGQGGSRAWPTPALRPSYLQAGREHISAARSRPVCGTLPKRPLRQRLHVGSERRTSPRGESHCLCPGTAQSRSHLRAPCVARFPRNLCPSWCLARDPRTQPSQGGSKLSSPDLGLPPRPRGLGQPHLPGTCITPPSPAWSTQLRSRPGRSPRRRRALPPRLSLPTSLRGGLGCPSSRSRV